MKGTVAVAVAALAGGAAAHVGHRHGHELFARKRGQLLEEVCVPGCTTIYTTITGEPTLVPHKPTPTPSSSSVPAVTTSVAPTTAAPTTSETPKVPLPTPNPVTCPTPGTYTFPATTITVSETTTVCVGTTTHVPAGTHTVGGVTTIVETATTVTCPVATVITEGTVVTSTIVNTEYVCPSAGTYTIGPITTTVTEECDVEYPVPTSYEPGTYTAPEIVVTVTETGYVTYCPFTSSGLPEPTYAPPPPPSAAPAHPAPSAPAPPAEQPKPSAAPAPKPPVSDKPKPSPPKGGLVGGNDHFGITYTPYEPSNGNCKSREAVDSDIKTLKQDGFSIIRVYSTDCDTLENVGDACRKYGMDMMVGVFVKASGCSYDVPEIKEQVDKLAAWAQWDMVKLLVVGNESVMNGFCSASQLAELISVVKSKCSTYTGPYTTAETLNVWENPEVPAALCGAIDITAANIHPYFNPNVVPEAAGEFVAGQLEILRDICPGKDVINLESGWPTRGNCNGSACPGQKEQAIAIKSIREACGDKTVFFSLDDDMWKEPGDCLCEQSWGTRHTFASA
ncbi:glycoside hydrolase superfamily [Stachybotrys elegans]|uniref:Probable beta-glucosidase btgE n=1 Tax=Stachybotrys elegans TaxID=80388 RepID=A0A8K0WVC0_9HYPO|nr:glycoside hydrolase superfamily [Stachybotrys elegans]